MYHRLRPLLFRLDAEHSHRLVFGALDALYRVPGAATLLRRRYRRHVPDLPVEIMGLRFPNPVGLAAGLDKDGRHVHPLADIGFGWLELGTVTPQPQPGNPGQRLFRLPQARALLNRMGFNSAGVDALVRHISRRQKPGLLGINIGKNRDTPIEHAIDDYLYCLRAVYLHAAYVAVNISSPNTPGLRALQEERRLVELLAALKLEQTALARAHGLYVPLALKIAPDLTDDEIGTLAKHVREHRFDAVIATNTTLTRPGIEHELLAKESGGLSGAPLKTLSTHVIRVLYRHLRGDIPIIGVGGIETAGDAWDKLVAGADLLQVYTAFIYKGPDLVRDIVTGLVERVHASGAASLAQAVAHARGQPAALPTPLPRAL